ncbi:RNA-binding S4 domain-containing protein [Pseudoduganella sp. DS3]|uniref:RNA-binding S4 domain-containing protein n=1 Tax=Pseudoduganella guangdongensis TaxID=2692179 RepID=A0A6N9HIX7_9BURK|nr:S4 domain-containing protein [Pseudoduganella guangdongensis]MYN02745.1 RNA-binding S4 domain-containing protein [Pseudoduganella guangdongensis]
MSNSDVRIDKWLWAARFFKTRQLAIDAIDKGKVKLTNGERIKPSRNAKLGERLHIDNGADEWDVLIVGISGKREGAPIARLLYEESAESLARRAALIERKKLFPEPFADAKGRPTKRDRRQWERATDA